MGRAGDWVRRRAALDHGTGLARKSPSHPCRRPFLGRVLLFVEAEVACHRFPRGLARWRCPLGLACAFWPNIYTQRARASGEIVAYGVRRMQRKVWTRMRESARRVEGCCVSSIRARGPRHRSSRARENAGCRGAPVPRRRAACATNFRVTFRSTRTWTSRAPHAPWPSEPSSSHPGRIPGSQKVSMAPH